MGLLRSWGSAQLSADLAPRWRYGGPTEFDWKIVSAWTGFRLRPLRREAGLVSPTIAHVATSAAEEAAAPLPAKAASLAPVGELTPFPSRLGQAELAPFGLAKAGLVFLGAELA
jgi:hypothetical protein